MSPAALDLAEQLLTYNPAQRITALQAMDAPYFISETPSPAPPVGYVLSSSFLHSPTDSQYQVGGYKRGVARARNEKGEGKKKRTEKCNLSRNIIQSALLSYNMFISIVIHFILFSCTNFIPLCEDIQYPNKPFFERM